MATLELPVYVVDETSQATEPVLCHVLRRPLEKIALLGDEKQLAPVVKQQSVRGALDRSIMDRLRGRAGVRSLMLEVQYRSHPSIMRFSSERFYHGKIHCGKNPAAFVWPAGIWWEKDDHIIFPT